VHGDQGSHRLVAVVAAAAKRVQNPLLARRRQAKDRAVVVCAAVGGFAVQYPVHGREPNPRRKAVVTALETVNHALFAVGSDLKNGSTPAAVVPAVRARSTFERRAIERSVNVDQSGVRVRTVGRSLETVNPLFFTAEV
jgi:hypothetical protein